MSDTIQISDMINIRIFYSKLERAKYISHLDITRCMQRALKRAGLPVWYTEGFNPHIYLTFALPLALGYESECESMDLRLRTMVDFMEVKDRLNAVLPPDIRVQSVGLQKAKPEVIKTALYEVAIQSESRSGGELAAALNELMSLEQIMVMKKTKKGKKEIDIKPDIVIKNQEAKESLLKLTMQTAAGIEKNINPTLLTDILLEKNGFDDCSVSVIRKAVYDENMQCFE